MNSETQHQYMNRLVESNRIVSGKVVPTAEEVGVIATLSTKSKFFRGLLEQYVDYGSLFPGAFIYVLEAAEEEQKRTQAQKKSGRLNSYPHEGEQVTLKINVAIIKDMKWEVPAATSRPHVHNGTGIIAYVGGTEIFFWGMNQRIQNAALKEGNSYHITGVVKSVDQVGDKLELTRISAIVPTP